jgi:hypothetical protein
MPVSSLSTTLISKISSQLEDDIFTLGRLILLHFIVGLGLVYLSRAVCICINIPLHYSFVILPSQSEELILSFLLDIVTLAS